MDKEGDLLFPEPSRSHLGAMIGERTGLLPAMRVRIVCAYTGRSPSLLWETFATTASQIRPPLPDAL